MCPMDDAVKMVLAEYDARAAAEAQLQDEIPADRFSEHRDEFLLAVGPEAGQLLNILAKGAKARAILEIGTSYGYSTIWLAEAARGMFYFIFMYGIIAPLWLGKSVWNLLRAKEAPWR